MDSTATSPTVKSGRRWLRRLVWFFLTLVVLVVVLYFVVTSSAFFKGVVLPRVSRSLNAEVTVREASLSPFSEVILRGLTVRTPGEAPVLTAEAVVARYDLKAILRGKIVVHEARLESPVVLVVRNADGTSNLDPFLKASGSELDNDDGTPSKASQLQIAKVSLQNGRVRMIKDYDAQHRDTTELSKLNVNLSNVRNGQEGTVDFSAEVTMTNNPPAPGTNGNMVAEATGNFRFMLTPDLKPATVQGAALFAIKAADGSLTEVTGLEAALRSEVTPTEIKYLALEFSKAKTNLGQVSISGPFDAAKTEGHLTVLARGIDRQILNLLGAAHGLDFGATTISATNEIDLTAGGSTIRSQGTLDIMRLSVTQEGETSPAVDLRLQFRTSVDQSNQIAELESFTLQGNQNGQPLLYGTLTSPMKISWGEAAKPLGDSALRLAVTNFHLADWRPFLGASDVDGVVAADLKLQSSGAADELTIDLVSRITDLSSLLGTNRISGAQAFTRVSAKVTQGDKVHLRETKLELTQGGAAVLSLSATGDYGVATGDANLGFNLESSLPGLLAILPQPDTTARSGTLQLQGRLTQTNGLRAIDASLKLAQFTGQYGEYQFTNFAARLQLDVGQDKQITDLRQVQLTLTPTDRAKNELNITGRLDLTDTNATQGSIKIASTGLDLTSYYDIFAAPAETSAAPASPKPTPTPAPTTTSPAPVEPKAMTLPLRNFAMEVAVAALYLREVSVTNWQTGLKIDSGRVSLKPIQLTLNGAPVKANAELNLGVDGYEYDFALDAVGIALEPLVNTFLPEDKGRYKGDLIAQAQFKGRGTTGVNLREHLAGRASITFTNADIQIFQPKLKKLLTPIALILNSPELLNSPLNHFTLQSQAGQGKIDVSQLVIASTAFRAETTGSIPIANVVMKSPLKEWPVAFSLSRSLASAVRLMPTNTPPSVQFVQLPDFIRLTGTLEEPAVKLDKLALTGSVLERFADKIPGLDEKTGNLLKELGGALGKPATTNAPASSTNTPAKPAFNPRDLFKKKK